MCHPFFDELRDPATRLPDSRHHNNPAKDMPNLFDFSRHGRFLLQIATMTNISTNKISELSIAPELNEQLVPPHARAALEARGLDINNFKPLSKEEMMAHLD